jgi:hypothetical protein
VIIEGFPILAVVSRKLRKRAPPQLSLAIGRTFSQLTRWQWRAAFSACAYQL